MSRLDFCEYELVDDCYDWKNDNCDECNIFKAYCEGERRAKNSIVRCKECRHAEHREQMPNQVYCKRDKLSTFCAVHDDDDFCKYGERREEVNGFKSVGQAWNTSQGRREP